MGYLLVILFAVAIFSYLSKGVKFSTNFLNPKSDEARYLIALLAKVAKSDGRINETEATIISQVLTELSLKFGVSRDELKAIYNREKENVNNAFGVAFEYNQKLKPNLKNKIGKIYFFLNLAYIDGSFNDAEKRIISEIADGFEIYRGLKEEIFSKFRAEFRARGNKNQEKQGSKGQSSSQQSNRNQKSPYEILGVDSSVSNSDLKKAYRALVKKYHPDILMGRGADGEIVEAGTKKLQEINEAYEKIKSERGI